MSADDHIVQEARDIAKKDGPRKGAQHINDALRQGVDPATGEPLSNKRKALLRGARKVLQEVVKRGIQIGVVIGVIIGPLIDPATAHAPTLDEFLKTKSR